MISVTHVDGDRLRIETRGHEWFADQPRADGGSDTAPTPTEHFVASLGACVAFYAERFLRRHELSTQGLRVTCDYTWAENPHRIGRIDVGVDVPGLPQARRQAFTRVVEHCTVHNSLLYPAEVRIGLKTGETAAA